MCRLYDFIYIYICIRKLGLSLDAIQVVSYPKCRRIVMSILMPEVPSYSIRGLRYMKKIFLVI